MSRLVVTATLLVAARSVAAQSPAERTAIEAFRDSIGSVRDSTPLLAHEAKLIRLATKELRDSAMVHLRLGFLALRLGDVAGHHHFEDAASEFQWAIDLQPRWPYAWFGLGLAELGVGDAEFSVIRGLQAALGKDALTRSANDFARSAEVDPGFVRGLVELSNTALRQRINLRLDVALAALRRAAHTSAGANPAVLLARARVEREVGSADSARVAIDSLLAHDPANAEALLEQARVRFKLGRRDGADPWYRGLALADSTALALYRADLLFVLPDSTMRSFTAATGEGRVTLMRRFWTSRDDDALRSPGARLMEHYRRLDYAQHEFRLASTRRHYDIVERYRPPAVEFDDRGVIYIRQGTPDDRATLSLPSLPPNESWVYHRPDGTDLLFHFVAREGVTDFRLVESALDVLGYAQAVRLENSGNIQGNDPAVFPSAGRPVVVSADSARALRQRAADADLSRLAERVLQSRERLDPIYTRMLASGRGGASGLEREERAIGNRSIRIGTTTDAWPRSFATRLAARLLELAAPGDSASSILRLAYAVPHDTGSTRIRAAVFAPDGSLVASADTVDAGMRTATDGKTDFRIGVIAMPVPAGRFTMRALFESGGAGAITNRDTIDVPRLGGAAPAMSDLVLGTPAVNLFWSDAQGDTIWVNPLSTFHAADPAQLAFEVTGVPVDSTYRVELTIRRPGGQSIFRRILGIFGGGASQRISFTRRQHAPRDLVRQGVDFHKLKPAAYVLEVTISAANRKKATRRLEFTVVH